LHAVLPKLDALLKLMSKNKVHFDEIDSVLVPTYQAAINVLSLPKFWSIASEFVSPGTRAAPIARGPSKISRGPKRLMSKNKVHFDEIDSVLVPTYQAAINVLSLSGNGDTDKMRAI
jgi:2-methylcitrate dehydratase PrpD